MRAISALLGVSFLTIGLAGFRTNQLAKCIRSEPGAIVDSLKIDAETGLIDDKNLMMVKAQCTACHSSKLILQHRFTREGWLDRIRWMQKYHKLWDLGESEKVVLDYLEKNYGTENARANATFRRAPLKNIQWYKLK